MGNETCYLVTLLNTDNSLLRVGLKICNDRIRDLENYPELCREDLEQFIPDYLKSHPIVEVENIFEIKII